MSRLNCYFSERFFKNTLSLNFGKLKLFDFMEPFPFLILINMSSFIVVQGSVVQYVRTDCIVPIYTKSLLIYNRMLFRPTCRECDQKYYI